MASDISDDDSLEFVDAEAGEADYAGSGKSGDSDHFEDATQDINEHKESQCLSVQLENVKYKDKKVEDTSYDIDSHERLRHESSIDTDSVNVKDLSLCNEDNTNSNTKVLTKDNDSEIIVVTNDLEGEEIPFSDGDNNNVHVSENARLDDDCDIAKPEVFIVKDENICNENVIIVQEIHNEQCLPQQSITASDDSEVTLILPVHDVGYFEVVPTARVGVSVENEAVIEYESAIPLETDSDNYTGDVDVDKPQCTLIVENVESGEFSNLSLKSSDEVIVKESNDNKHEICSDDHYNVVQCKTIESNEDFVSNDMPENDDKLIDEDEQEYDNEASALEYPEITCNVQDNTNESINDSSHLSGGSLDEFHNVEQCDNSTDNVERDMHDADGCSLNATQEIYDEEETPVQDFFDTPLMIGHPLSLQQSVIPMPWPIQVILKFSYTCLHVGITFR